jgi:hypothetical protein
MKYFILENQYVGASLSELQRLVLSAIAASPTAELAYHATIGAENIVSARTSLRSMGLVAVSDEQKKAALTQSGDDVMLAAGLIDETGNFSEEAQSAISKLEQIKDQFNEATRPFAFISKL